MRPFALIEIPDIRQEDDYSCGACASMSCGQYRKVGPKSLPEWKKLLGTTKKKSTDPGAIVKVLTDFGLEIEAKQNLQLNDLFNYWVKGWPVICPIQEYMTPSKQTSYLYGHYVVVLGIDLGYIFVQDSSIDNVLEHEGTDQAPGRMIISENLWKKVWHDKDLYEKQYIHYGIAVGEKKA